MEPDNQRRGRGRMLLVVAVVVALAATLLTAYAIYQLDPIRKYVRDDGTITIHGGAPPALISYLLHGPFTGPTTQYVMVGSGFGTAAFREEVLPFAGIATGPGPVPDHAKVASGGPDAFVAELVREVRSIGAQLGGWFFSLFTMNGAATGCTGTGTCYWVGGTGNFSSTAHWATTTGGGTTGGLPGATDAVVFDASSGAGTATQDNVTFTSGAVTMTNSSVTIDGSSHTWNVGGSWSDANGKFTVTTSTVVFTATGTVTGKSIAGCGAGRDFYNVTVNNGVTATWANSTPVQNVTTVNGTITLQAKALFICDDAGVQDPLVIGGSGVIGSTGGTGTLYFYTAAGATIDVPGGTFASTAINLFPQNAVAGDGVRYVLTGDLNLQSAYFVFVCANNVPYYLDTGTHNVTLGNGNDDVSWLVNGSCNYGIKATSGTWSLTGNMNASNAAQTGFYMQLGSTSWNVGGQWLNGVTTNSAKWSVGTSTVTFDATASKSMTFAAFGAGTKEFYNVTFNSGANTATYTMGTNPLQWAGVLNVTGGAGTTTLATSNLTLIGGSIVIGNAGVLTANASTVEPSAVTMTGGASGTITVTTGSWSITGSWDTSGVGSTFTPGTTSIFTFNVTGTVKLLAAQDTFSAMSVTTGIVTLQSNVVVTNTLTVSSGTLAIGAETLTVGALTMNGGNVTMGAGSVSDSGALTVSSASSTMTGAAGASVTVASTTLSGGVVTMGAGDFTSTGTVSITSATSNLTSSSGALVAGALSMSNGYVSTSTGTVTVNGNVSITGTGAYLSMGSNTWTVTGTWSNASTASGSWNPGTSTVVFTSATGGTMTFAGLNMSVNEFYNVEFQSSAATAQTFTMATRAIHFAGTLTVSDPSSTTALDTSASNLAVVGGSLNVGAGGILDLRASAVTITGNWTDTSSTTWGAWTGTIAFSGAAQTIAPKSTHTFPPMTLSGSGTKNFTTSFNTASSVTSGANATFGIGPGVTWTVAPGSTVTVNGAVAWNGSDVSPITITSSASWTLDTNSQNFTVSYVTISNSRVVGGWSVYDCPGGTDGGGNNGWFFPGGGCNTQQIVNTTIPDLTVILTVLFGLSMLVLFVFAIFMLFNRGMDSARDGVKGDKKA